MCFTYCQSVNAWTTIPYVCVPHHAYYTHSVYGGCAYRLPLIGSHLLLPTITALENVMKVETLCSTSLAEVGIAVEDFVQALEASRLSQDISRAVYEQLVALDDFVTFKKLMVCIYARGSICMWVCCAARVLPL